MFENSKWIQFVIGEDPTVEKHHPVPYIAKTFALKDKPKKAVLNICGYGEAAYYINENVIPDSFRPTYPSVPSKTIVYNEYDVTALLNGGNNRIGILLSDHRCISKGHNRMLKYSKVQSVVLQLDIEYNDGTTDTLVSDTSFKGAPSPIVFAEFVCGEIYDARREIDGWCNPDFDDSGWDYVTEIPAPGGEYRTTLCPPVRKMSEHKGVEIHPNLYDFGLITSGHVRIKVTGKTGNVIKLDYSERLLPDGKHVDGSAYKREERKFPDMYNSDEFILDGTKDKVMEDLFSIHGFRYVEVTGEYDSIELIAIASHTDIKTKSSFECDNEIINGIHNACIYSIKTCCQGYFVDNPKRDAAWLGDLMLSAESLAINFDSYGAAYENLVTCVDSQTEEGALPARAPQMGSWQYNNFVGPDWTDGVFFHVPYFVYKYTGNIEIIDKMWESMNKSLDFFKTLGDGGYLINQRGTGDWSAVKPGCSLEVAMTSYYRVSALMMGELADATGRDSKKYYDLADAIKAEFREKYVVGGRMNANHLSEYILSAACGFLNEDETKEAIENIIRMIKEDNMAMTFGVHGLRMIFDLLSKHGYEQFVFDLLTNDKVLGFAKNVKDGLNTLPERFNYHNNAIMSLNHHFFSGVDAWFYKWLTGIKINGFGYKDIVISPSFVKGIDKVKTNLHGIIVNYNKEKVVVDSPYAFTFKMNGVSKQCEAGKYEFFR